MLGYITIAFLIYYTHSPWWLYAFVLTGMGGKILTTAIEIYEAGKEHK